LIKSLFVFVKKKAFVTDLKKLTILCVVYHNKNYLKKQFLTCFWTKLYNFFLLQNLP